MSTEVSDAGARVHQNVPVMKYALQFNGQRSKHVHIYISLSYILNTIIYIDITFLWHQ